MLAGVGLCQPLPLSSPQLVVRSQPASSVPPLDTCVPASLWYPFLLPWTVALYISSKIIGSKASKFNESSFDVIWMVSSISFQWFVPLLWNSRLQLPIVEAMPTWKIDQPITSVSLSALTCFNYVFDWVWEYDFQPFSTLVVFPQNLGFSWSASSQP